MASFILLDDQTVVASVSYADDAGNAVPTPAGVSITYTSVDPDGTITVTPSADTLSAVITATGKVTSTQDAQVTVSDGTLSGSVMIHVDLSAAATIVVGLGTPSHK